MTSTHALDGIQTSPSLTGLTRWLLACCAAFVITIALFLFMRFLVHVEGVQMPEAVPRPDVFINERIDPIDPQPRTLPQLEPVVAPPVTPTLTIESTGAPSEVGFTQVQPPQLAGPGTLTSMAPVAINPPPLSIRRSPDYPALEQRRGISGQCTVRYDILASGRTANLQVTRCDSAGFARASLNAVTQWRHEAYTGRSADAVISRGVETTLVFELEG